ncbi:hypothetical protein HY732_01110 [Candidatus Uhrbacteria bacterium]|nr:hypothetical protein [Candidatus Uhrbacteria bacterium]
MAYTEEQPSGASEEQRFSLLIDSLNGKIAEAQGEKRDRLAQVVQALERLRGTIPQETTLESAKKYRTEFLNCLALIAELLNEQEMSE